MTATSKTILITGASSGIGRATALRLAHHGWRVFAAVRRDSDAQALIADAHGTVEGVLLDVTDNDSIAAAARDITARLAGRGLDALFNNAGIGAISPVEFTPPAALREIYEVNVFGQIAVLHAFLPLLRLAKGRIINTGSVGDHLSPPFVGALCSSKAAFASISAALRLELRPQGIHVCVLEPGAINTPAVGKTLGKVERVVAALPPQGAALYGEPLRRLARTFAKNERAGSSPDAVAAVVERALTDRYPKTRYAAGKDSLKLAMLARWLPEKLLDLAILKKFGLPGAFGAPAK
jgi:NAD(P)-dependent dehydrogenase (short-subunit alcohol dehydrogenase family)